MPSMIRVKIRLSNGGGFKKLYRFEEGIEFEKLLLGIAAKLGISCTTENRDPTKTWRLLLGGDACIESSDEIDHGDDLVLDCSNDTVKEEDDYDNVKHESAPVEDRKRKSEGISSSSHDIESKDKKLPADSTRDKKIQGGSVRKGRESSMEEDDSSVEDVTEQVAQENAARRELRAENDHISIEDSDNGYMSESEDELSIESDVDEESEFEYDSLSSSDEEESKKKASKPILPFIRVEMNPKDIPAAPGCDEARIRDESESSMNAESSFIGNKDGAIKARILKLLNTGFHEASNEHEAKNAMKLAQRLMQKHNLSQVILMKERDVLNEGLSESLKGGMAKVKIVTVKTGKPATYNRWMQSLAQAICKNFRVNSFYCNSRNRCSVTFYGIYVNVQLAAYSFKVATERVSVLMQQYAKSVQTRTTYARGIAEGLRRDVEENLEREEAKRKQKLEKARLSVMNGGEAYEESDDDSDSDDDGEGGGFSFPETIPSSMPAMGSVPYRASAEMPVQSSQTKVNESTSNTAHSASERLERLERREEATLALVDHHEKVAKDVLKENKIKLKSGRKMTSVDTNSSAYADGIKDSKELDINQRAIRNEIKVKKEKGRN